MKINHIRNFIAIANTNSINKAAQTLSISQQTLSNSLKVLESEVGTQLCVRTNKGVVLTERGKEFLRFAHETCDSYDRMMYEWHRNDIYAEIERLRVGVMDSITTFVPPFIADFIERNPYIDLHVYAMPLREILEKVASGKLDCGLILRIANKERIVPVIEKPFVLHRLAPCKNYCWISNKSHFSMSSTISMKRMLEQKFVLRDSVDQEFFEIYFGDNMPQVLNYPLVNEPSMIAEIVARNLAVCPDSQIGNRPLIMDHVFDGFPVKSVPVRTPVEMQHDACIVVHESAQYLSAVSLFMEELLKFAGNVDSVV